MAAMHYTVMVERSSVKVFFLQFQYYIYFTFYKVNTLKNYKIEKPKIYLLTYLSICSTLKKIMTTSLLLIRVRITLRTKVHAKNKSFSCGFAINCRQVLSPRNINKYKILQAFNDLFSSENMQYLIQLFTLIVIIPAIVSV